MTAAEFHANRRRLGLTQAGLAGLIGVTAHAVANWESGRRGVPLYAANMLRLLDAATGEQVDTLIAARRG